MMSRPHARMRRAAGSLLFAVGLLTLAGCDPRALMYFLQPFDPKVPAPGPSLQSKRVVVLAHAVDGTQADFPSLERDLTRDVVNHFREHVKHIDVVDPDKVWGWVEGHPNWTNPADAAKAFEADVVVFLEIETFQVTDASSPGLLHGVGKIHVKAVELRHPKNSRGRAMTDKPKEEHDLYDDYVDTEFPKRGPISMDSGVSQGAFKNRFLKIVATDVAWQFVEHAPEDDVGDTRFK